MKTYEILFEEVLLHRFELEAASAADVPDEFERLADECYFDFSDGEVVDSGIRQFRCAGSGKSEKIGWSHADLERLAYAFTRFAYRARQWTDIETWYDTLLECGCTLEDIETISESFGSAGK